MATNSTRGNAKIWFIGGGVVAAAALVIFLRNYPPAPADAAGTVGAAQRYSSTQITKDDVTVAPDTLTTWLQSDTFDKIVKDPKAREIFSNAAFLQVAMDATARNIVLGGGASKAVDITTANAVNAVLGDAALKAALNSASVQNLLGDARIQGLFAKDGANAVLKDGAVQAAMLQDANIKAVFGNVSVLTFLGEVAKINFDGNMSKVATLQGDMGKVATLQGDMGKVFSLADAATFLTSNSAKLFESNAALVQTARDNAAIMNAVSDGAFIQAIRNGAVRDALVSEATKAQPE